MANLKARCPNDPTHKTFYTTAHVAETWKVDEAGEFIEVPTNGDSEVMQWPSPDNTWECCECSAEAIVERV